MNDFRPGRKCRKGRSVLKPETQALAGVLARRALQMREDPGCELSIAEAVDLAAFRMGVEVPQNGTELEPSDD